MTKPCGCTIREGHLVERCPEAERLWADLQEIVEYRIAAIPLGLPRNLPEHDTVTPRHAYEDHLIRIVAYRIWKSCAKREEVRDCMAETIGVDPDP